jgi:flagellar biosynthetic protein FliO
MNSRATKSLLCAFGLLLPAIAFADTNTFAISPAPIPSATGSVIRMLASLAFVLALFFGGVWLFKNWQRVARIKNKSKLRIVEVQTLGPRQAIYVIGYQQQRFLVGATQAGVSLISALPEGESVEEKAETNGASASFATLLQHALGRK